MNLRAASVIAVSLLTAACEPGEVSAPARPTKVPAAAVWAGGADGGAWIECSVQRSVQDHYRCRVYDDYEGSVWAEGEYVLRLSRWNTSEKNALLEPANQPAALRYSSFDGRLIHLADSLVLVPDGWINYPFNSGGKKQLYELGERQGEEVQYE